MKNNLKLPLVSPLAKSHLQLMLLGCGEISFIAPKVLAHRPPKSDLREYLMAVKVGSKMFVQDSLIEPRLEKNDSLFNPSSHLAARFFYLQMALESKQKENPVKR